jgi:hypothetical protein
MKSLFLLLVASLALSPTRSLRAQETQTFSSGPQQVALVELYTSEGCSSCPPAEKWLGDLRRDSGLWKRFVPIAFHVTYWNYLGWTDAASQEMFNERQRRYAATWSSGSVYTPCFVRNGEEWHRENGSASLKTGTLTLKVTADRPVAVTFQPVAPGDYDVHLATISGRFETPVRAGENAGRTLAHDFVALSLQTVPLAPGATHTASLALATSEQPIAPRAGIVAWVTKRGDSRPVQALGGFF